MERGVRALLHIALGCLLLATGAAASDAFKNLPAGHWTRRLACKLEASGVKLGVAGEGPVTRYRFAQALDKAVKTLDSEAAPRLTTGDVGELGRLVQEFGEELSLLGGSPKVLQGALAAYRPRKEAVSEKVDRLIRCDRRKVRFAGGLVRAAEYTNDAGSSRGNLVLGAELRASPHLEGRLDAQFVARPDAREEDGLGLYQAYLELGRLGSPVERARLGRFNTFVGAGQVLVDRVQGLDLTGAYRRNRYEALLGDDLVLQMVVPGPAGGELGYYYIKREADAGGYRPFHVGLFARGSLGDRLRYGFEFSDYDNRVPTGFNNNSRTRGYLTTLDFKMGRRLGISGAAIFQEEDFRGFSIDHDLQFRGAQASPLEDVLQALDSFSGGITAQKNEINGLRDWKLGLWAKPFDDRTTLALGMDDVGSHSSLFDTSRDRFTVWTAGVSRALDDASDLSLRLRAIDFAFENPTRLAGTVPILRQDASELRAQYVRRF
ncbi:MAG: hypothetical protein HYY25_10170 [Candidatus Wallbacteria bacterium]|nr:hypothetical protein [Candidatus Wallbacteria bacterium]